MTSSQIAEAQDKALNWFAQKESLKPQPLANIENTKEEKPVNIEPSTITNEGSDLKRISPVKVEIEKEITTSSLAEIKDNNNTFSDCEGCPQMVKIPAGSYSRGTKYGTNNQRPKHDITIPKSFSVGAYEVTISEWEACVADGGCDGYRPYEDIDTTDIVNYPVTNVNWNDVHGYVSWLSQKTGRFYRLLSEAEWEYVARAGTETRFSWGDSLKEGRNTLKPGDDVGGRVPKMGKGMSVAGVFFAPTLSLVALKAFSSQNYNDVGVTPVGSYISNSWGLYDVHGNVWEWTEDCYNENYFGAPLDGSARTEKCSKRLNRVLRGGTVMNNLYLEISPSGERSSAVYNDRKFNIGFRVARDN